MLNKYCLDCDSLLFEYSNLPSNTQKKTGVSHSSRESEISEDIKRRVRGYDVVYGKGAQDVLDTETLPEIRIPGFVNYPDADRKMHYVASGVGAKAIDVKKFSPKRGKMVLEQKKNTDDDRRLDLVVDKTTACLVNFFNVNNSGDYYNDPLSFDLGELEIGGYDDESMYLLYSPDQLVAASRRVKFLEDLTDRLTANLNDKFYSENGTYLFDVSIEGSRLVIKVSQPTFVDKFEKIGRKGKSTLNVLTHYTNSIVANFVKPSVERTKLWGVTLARKAKTFLVNKGVLHEPEVE